MSSTSEREDLAAEYHQALNSVSSAARILEDTATRAEKFTGRYGGVCPANLINMLYEAFTEISKAQHEIRTEPTED